MRDASSAAKWTKNRLNRSALENGNELLPFLSCSVRLRFFWLQWKSLSKGGDVLSFSPLVLACMPKRFIAMVLPETVQ
jgi:hypothetical protein